MAGNFPGIVLTCENARGADPEMGIACMDSPALVEI